MEVLGANLKLHRPDCGRNKSFEMEHDWKNDQGPLRAGKLAGGEIAFSMKSYWHSLFKGHIFYLNHSSEQYVRCRHIMRKSSLKSVTRCSTTLILQCSARITLAVGAVAIINTYIIPYRFGAPDLRFQVASGSSLKCLKCSFFCYSHFSEPSR